MKEALVAPNQPAETGWRIAQVVAQGQTFPVGDPLFWTECADNVVADLWYYDFNTQQCVEIPIPPPPETVVVSSEGTQQL